MTLTLTPEEADLLAQILTYAEDEARCGGYWSHAAVEQLLAKVEKQIEERAV